MIKAVCFCYVTWVMYWQRRNEDSVSHVTERVKRKTESLTVWQLSYVIHIIKAENRTVPQVTVTNIIFQYVYVL